MTTEATSSEVEEFLRGSSDEVAAYLKNSIPVIQQLPEKLRHPDSQEGTALLASAVQGLGLLNDYLQALQAIPRIVQSGQAASFAEIERKMGEGIQQMATAMEQQDQLLLADIIEYELLPALGELQHHVDRLSS
ncbi:MAG: hypothetical protein K0A95_11225 [Chromatiales bacterium]|nr:hypothetical protein [Gammaproteobacteria bacterium]MBW6477630.1 hypothetical protein [Chromatiales bacterium]